MTWSRQSMSALLACGRSRRSSMSDAPPQAARRAQAVRKAFFMASPVRRVEPPLGLQAEEVGPGAVAPRIVQRIEIRASGLVEVGGAVDQAELRPRVAADAERRVDQHRGDL